MVNISELYILIFKVAAVNYNTVRDQYCRLASNLASIFFLFFFKIVSMEYNFQQLSNFNFYSISLHYFTNTKVRSKPSKLVI